MLSIQNGDVTVWNALSGLPSFHTVVDQMSGSIHKELWDAATVLSILGATSHILLYVSERKTNPTPFWVILYLLFVSLHCISYPKDLTVVMNHCLLCSVILNWFIVTKLL